MRRDSRQDAGRTLLFCCVAVASQATSAVGQQVPSAEEFARELDAFIEEVMAFDLAPGLAVAVVRGDEKLFEAGYGYADVESRRPVTPETVFYIASSTKSFTGMAAAILHGAGELDLDGSLASMLPGVELGGDLDPSMISLRDLLTHTHGIENTGPVSFRSAFSGVHTHDMLVDLLSAHGPAEDGRSFEYGNIGYNVASLAMDAHLGTSWKDVLAREIFGPLGMRATTAYVSRVPEERLAMPYGAEPEGFERVPYHKGDGSMHAAGGLVTTVSDVALWLRANLNEGRLGTEQLLDPRAVATAHRSYVQQDASYMSFNRTGYGLGWNTGSYDGDSFTHHFGGFSGFHTHISFMPERDIGVAVLVNTGSGSFVADLISRYAYDVLRGVPDLEGRWSDELAAIPARIEQMRSRIKADRDRRAARPQTLPYPLTSYTGAFENDELGRLELSLVNGALEARMGRMWSEVEVYDNQQNILRVELTGGGSVMPVEFDEGQVMAARVRWLGRVFERVER